MALAWPILQEAVHSNAEEAKTRRSYWIPGVALALFQIVLLWGFWRCLDLHIADEFWYYERGRALLAGKLGELSFVYSPVSSLLYAILELLPLGGVLRCDVMFVIVALASTLALWWMLRTVVPGSAAVLFAAWWAASPIVLNDTFVGGNMLSSVYVLGMALACLAVGFANRGRPCLALFLLVLAALNRPECLLWLLTLGALQAAQWLYPRSARKARRLPVALFVGLSLVAVHLVEPGARERSWFAFSQHYAWSAVERSGHATPEAARAAMDDPEPLVRADFPKARSIFAAAIENPGKLGAHILANAAGLDAALGQLMLGPFTSSPYLMFALTWLLRIFVGLGIIACALGLAERGEESRSVDWVFVSTALPVLAFVLVIRARADLLVPIAPFGFVAMACLACRGLRMCVRDTIVVPLGAVVSLLALGLPAKPFLTPPPAPLPHRSAISLLAGAALPDSGRLLSLHAEAYRVLSRRENLESLDLGKLTHDERFSGISFADLHAILKPDLVLVTPSLLSYDSRHAGLREHLSGEAWTEVASEGGLRLLARRRE